MFGGDDLVGGAVHQQQGDGADLRHEAAGAVAVAHQDAGAGEFVVGDAGIRREGGFDGHGAHAGFVACAHHGNGVGAAQALAEHEQAFGVYIGAAAHIIQRGVAVGKQAFGVGLACGLAVAAIVEQENVVAVFGQPFHGLPVGGEVLRVAVEVDDGGAGLFGISHTACGHKPAVQGCAVGALEGDVFVGQAGLGGRAVVGMVGIVKGLFGAGGQAEQNGEEGG